MERWKCKKKIQWVISTLKLLKYNSSTGVCGLRGETQGRQVPKSLSAAHNQWVKGSDWSNSVAACRHFCTLVATRSEFHSVSVERFESGRQTSTEGEFEKWQRRPLHRLDFLLLLCQISHFPLSLLSFFFAPCSCFSVSSCPILSCLSVSLSMSFSFWSPPALTAASGDRVDRCHLRERLPCVFTNSSKTCSARLSAHHFLYHPLLSLYTSPFSPPSSLTFSFPFKKAGPSPLCLGNLSSYLFTSIYAAQSPFLSLYISPLISLCISLPFPFFLHGWTTSSGPLYLLDGIANFHIRSDKKNIARSVISFSHSSAVGSILLQLECFFFFFSRILLWLPLHNDFKVELNVFICWRLKDFLYLYPLTDQIRASLVVCRAAIDEAQIVPNTSHQKSFLSYNDLCCKDKTRWCTPHEERKKKNPTHET